jgi:hypothetical protein
MTLLENQELRDSLARLTDGMIGYMQEANPNYSKNDIDKCSGILTSHIQALERIKSREEAIALVEATVLKLNKLNQDTHGDLIETDQREEICALIIKAGAIKGFNSINEDVTEEWREW